MAWFEKCEKQDSNIAHEHMESFFSTWQMNVLVKYVECKTWKNNNCHITGFRAVIYIPLKVYILTYLRLGDGYFMSRDQIQLKKSVLDSFSKYQI